MDARQLYFGIGALGARETIRVGSTGEDVKAAQASLGVEADGIFGPLTDAAVRAFQASKGLVVDGIVGPKTWAAMGEIGVSKPAAAPAPVASRSGSPVSAAMVGPGSMLSGVVAMAKLHPVATGAAAIAAAWFFFGRR